MHFLKSWLPHSCAFGNAFHEIGDIFCCNIFEQARVFRTLSARSIPGHPALSPVERPLVSTFTNHQSPLTLHRSLATCRSPLIDSCLRIGAWPGEISENA